MIVDLADMVTEMRDEVKEPLAGLHGRVCNRLGKRLRDTGIRQAGESRIDRASRRIDLGENLVATDTAAREFDVARANVSGVAELCADEVLEIAAEMEREIAGGVRDAAWNFPQHRLVG